MLRQGARQIAPEGTIAEHPDRRGRPINKSVDKSFCQPKLDGITFEMRGGQTF